MTINGQTVLTGLVGGNIAGSPSPAMHNAAFEALGLNWVYLPLEVEPGRLEPALEGLRSTGFRGLNVTIPHKVEAFGLVDEARGDALVLGAVNTVSCEGGGMIGYNTDAEGLLRSLREAGAAPAGPVLMIGAGGAARAAALALSRLGADSLHILNRSRERAEELCRTLKSEGIFDEIYIQEYEEAGARVLRECSCVVNSTPLDRDAPGELPIDYGMFAPGQVALDLGYLAHRSAFLREAEKRGAMAVNGRPMLLYQAAEAFRIWTGEEPPLAKMRRALEEELMRGRDGKA
jgi:shikimate dehydrogenase